MHRGLATCSQNAISFNFLIFSEKEPFEAFGKVEAAFLLNLHLKFSNFYSSFWL